MKISPYGTLSCIRPRSRVPKPGVPAQTCLKSGCVPITNQETFIQCYLERIKPQLSPDADIPTSCREIEERAVRVDPFLARDCESELIDCCGVQWNDLASVLKQTNAQCKADFKAAGFGGAWLDFCDEMSRSMGGSRPH